MPPTAAPGGAAAAPRLSQKFPPPALSHPRLLVQKAAADTKRRHFFRAVRRVTLLLATDVAVLALARASLEFLRTLPWTSAWTAVLFPRGVVSGWGSLAALLVGLGLVGAYESEERWAVPGTLLRGVALGAALALWQSIDSRGVLWAGAHWVLVSIGIGGPLVLARSLLRKAVVRYRIAAKPSDRVILVGDPQTPAGRQAAAAILHRPGMLSLGWLSERVDADAYLGHPSAVWEVLCQTRTDTVVLCGNIAPEHFDTVVEAAAVAGCRVLSVRNRGTLMASQPRALNEGDTRMLELTFPAARAGQDVVKRMFDILVASALLVVLSPLLLAIAIWVRLDSEGPVLFIQERVGQAGRVFRMLKFRTMRMGADLEKSSLAHLNHTGDPRLFKIPHDPRITKAGAQLRCWSLDELPQLVNVIRGDMSLVGPRPFFESDLSAYDDHQFIRLAVKPGITGLWQVRGRSTIVDFEEVVRLDRQYIEEWSFWLDLKILLATLPALFRKVGAY